MKTMTIRIVPLSGRPGWFAVCLGGGVYNVDPAGCCTCPAFQFQPVGDGRETRACKHLVALRDHLRRQRECPVCSGRGLIAPRLVYVGPDGQPDATPLPCAACSGTGERQPVSLPSEQELREIFS